VGYRDARRSSHANVKPDDTIVGPTVSHTIACVGETGTIARRTITVAEGDVTDAAGPTRDLVAQSLVCVRRWQLRPCCSV
jgi:hypothetical protein